MSSDRSRHDRLSQPTVNDAYTDRSLVVTTGEATMMALIAFFVLLFVVLILYLRAKHYRSVAHDALVVPPDRAAARSRSPLDPSVLKSLPITVFRSQDFKLEGGKDCAVCLSEFTDGEEARILPKCNHGFHVECIDMWFISNSTCPLCRLPVALTSSVEPPEDVAVRKVVDSESCVVDIDEGSSSAACSSSGCSYCK